MQPISDEGSIEFGFLQASSTILPVFGLPLNHFVPYFLAPCGAAAGVLQRDLKVK